MSRILHQVFTNCSFSSPELQKKREEEETKEFSLVCVITRTFTESAKCSYFIGERGRVTCICHDTGMCHYFGYFLGSASGFLGAFLSYFRISGYHFFAKSDFFKNNPGF